MPVLSRGELRIDYTDEGSGPPVVLIHSSVSANRQWRSLTEALKDRYRVLAINLHGYGETTPWPEPGPRQTLRDQARLVLELCEGLGEPIHLVGHSFGGSVALVAAQALGSRLGRLVLVEPNTFHLLRLHHRTEALREIEALGDHIKDFGAAGNWTALAERFADYWLGDGAWSAMPQKRRDAFVASQPPVFHEYDAVIGEQTPVEAWKAMTAKTLVVSDPATRFPIREIVAVLAEAFPHWTFHDIPEGGHMAPLTHPQVVNPVIRRFLDGHFPETPSP